MARDLAIKLLVPIGKITTVRQLWLVRVGDRSNIPLPAKQPVTGLNHS
jgi:hypothetical protein